MSRSTYDPNALKKRAEHWRAEATAATVEAVRAFCLDEAEECDRRVRQSLSTPVFSEMQQPQPYPGDASTTAAARG